MLIRYLTIRVGSARSQSHLRINACMCGEKAERAHATWRRTGMRGEGSCDPAAAGHTLLRVEGGVGVCVRLEDFYVTRSFIRWIVGGHAGFLLG